MDAFDVVTRYDDAIDLEAMTEEAKRLYIETMDVRHLIYAGTPTIWHCRRLRSSEMDVVFSQPNEHLQWKECFKMGLVRVSSLRRGDSRETWVRPSEKPLNEKQIDLFAPMDIREVGAAIYARSVLGKDRPAAWPLPATSRLAAEALDAHRAAQRRASAESSARSKQPLAEQGPAPASSSASGGTPGAATATG